MITHGLVTHEDGAPCEFCEEVKKNYLRDKKTGKLFENMRNENPKFKDIIDIFSDEEIVNRLVEIYPDQNENKDGYLSALKEIRTLKPKSPGIKLLVTRFKDEGKYYTDICGHKKGKEMTYAIEFMDWTNWLGMKIHPDSRVHYNYLDIAAHALWEMTWSGFSQSKVSEKSKIIDSKLKIIKKNENAKNNS